MECLAAGRAVCLPGTANASSKVSTYGIFNYARHRRQFNIPLIKMEGIQSKLADMIYNTWIIQSSVELTNSLLDEGEKPAVISAIMKEQTTERARTVLNHGMDIHAGSSICLGENNFMEKFYRSAPVGITVEGSKHSLSQLILYPRSTTLDNQTRAFANLSNFVALLGGSIKKNQFISGDMAQLLSNLYLAHSVRWYHTENPVSPKLTDYCINRLLEENQVLINRVIDNYPSVLRVFLRPMRKSISSSSYDSHRDIVTEVDQNNKIMESIKEHVYEAGILEELNRLNSLDQDSDEYKQLYQKIIQVGEYPIESPLEPVRDDDNNVNKVLDII